jgi:histidyl-tRNA synthetase
MVITIGDAARLEGLRVADELRTAGFRVDGDLLGRNAGAQMKYADKIRARYAVVLGGDEIAGNTVTLREMASGTETVVPRPSLRAALAAVLRPGPTPQRQPDVAR